MSTLFIICQHCSSYVNNVHHMSTMFIICQQCSSYINNVHHMSTMFIICQHCSIAIPNQVAKFNYPFKKDNRYYHFLLLNHEFLQITINLSPWDISQSLINYLSKRKSLTLSGIVKILYS